MAKAFCDFRAVPKPGKSITYDGQPFTAVDTEWYTNEAGKQVRLILWHSCCRVCGSRFTMKTTLKAQYPSRRNCPTHRWRRAP